MAAIKSTEKRQNREVLNSLIENFDDSISQRFEAPQTYYNGTNGLEEDLQEAEPPIPSFDLPSARRTVVSKWQNFEPTEEE